MIGKKTGVESTSSREKQSTPEMEKIMYPAG